MTPVLQWTPYTLPVFAACLLTGLLAVHLVRYWRALGVHWLFALLCATSFWGFVYGLELLAVTRPLKLFFAQLKYLGIVVTPVAWLGFTLIYAGRGHMVTRQRAVFAALLPTVFALLAITNQQHEWLWRNAVIETNGPLSTVSVTYAPLFWAHTAYSYALISAGIVLLWGLVRRARDAQRMPAILMLVGAVVPFIGNVISLVGGDALFHLDLTPISFTVSGLCFAWDFLRLRLLDLMPRVELPVRVDLDADVELRLHQTRERVLELLIQGTLVLGLVTVIPTIIGTLRLPAKGYHEAALFSGAYVAVLSVYFVRGMTFKVRAAAFALVWYLFGVCSALLFGLESDAGITLFAFVLFTYLLFGTRPSLAALGLVTLTSSALAALLLTGGYLPQQKYAMGSSALDLVSGSLILVLASCVAIIAINRLQRDAVALIRRAGELSARLEQERASLERRVAARTRALEAGFAISRLVGSIHAREALSQQVASEIQKAFDLCHVRVYHLVEGVLVVDGQAAARGTRLFRQNHPLAIGQGAPGQAASSRAPAMVHPQDDGAFPEPLAELAVPIQLGDRLLGVLDIHQDRRAALDGAMVLQMQSLASKLALALQDIEIRQAARQNAQLDARLNSIGRQIRSASTTEMACQLAVRELGRALGDGKAWVSLAGKTAAQGSVLPGGHLEREDHVA